MSERVCAPGDWVRDRTLRLRERLLGNGDGFPRRNVEVGTCHTNAKCLLVDRTFDLDGLAIDTQGVVATTDLKTPLVIADQFPKAALEVILGDGAAKRCHDPGVARTGLAAASWAA